MSIENEVNEVFGSDVKSTFGHNGIHLSETLRKTVYFTGVPIEGEANKVFWVVPSLHSDITENIRQKNFGKPFTLRPCLWEKSEVKCFDENK